MSKGRKQGLIVLMVFILLASGLPAVERITGKCAFFMKVANMKDVAEQVVSYASLAGSRMTADQLLTAVSMRLFGRSGFPGIDVNRPVRMYLYRFPGSVQFGGKQHILLELSLSDKALFKQIVAPRMQRSSGTVITYRGGRALVASSSKAYAEYRSGRSARDVRLVKDSQLSFYVNVRLFKGEIAKVFGKMSRMRGPGSGLMSGIVKMYMKLIRDTAGLGYGVTLDRDGLELGVAMNFVSGSGFARAFRESRSDRLKVLSILPADSFGVAAGKNPVRGVIEYFGPMLEPIKSVHPVLRRVLDAMLSYARENSTGESAFAMLPARGLGLSFAAVSGVRSASSARVFYRKMCSIFNGFPLLRKLKAQGTDVKLVFEEGAETISGRSVDICKLRFTFARPVPAHAAAMVNMLRKLFTVKIAYYRGYELAAIGENATVRLRQMIRNCGGGGSGFKSSSAYRKVNRRFGKYAKNSLFYISMKKFMKEVMEIAVPMSGRMAPMLRMIRIPGAVYGYGYTSRKGLKMRMLMDREAIMGMFNLMRYFMVQKKAAAGPGYRKRHR